MIHGAKALPAAALLAGCAAIDTPDACRLTQVATIPIRMAGNAPLLDVAIDGKPVTLMLDTGADGTLINEEAFTRLGLAHDFTLPSYTTGLGARGSDWATQKATLTVGGHALDPIPLYVAKLGKMPSDGLLGGRSLSKFDLDIDMPNHRLTLYAARRCPGGPPPFSPSATLPTMGFGLYRVGVQVTLDDVALWTEVDTGATRTLIDRERAGLSEADLASDRSGRMTTADPVGLPVHMHRFKRLAFGTETIEGPSLMVGDIRRSGHDGLLGSDVWRNRRLWISYAGRTVTVGPRQQPPPRPTPPP